MKYISLNSGPVDYTLAYEWQRTLQRKRREAVIDDTLLLIEHQPTITIGRGSRDESDLISTRADLANRGIAVVVSDRGGEITYHAPGQLVGYPIIDLNNHGRDLHKYLRDLEETIIETLAAFDVTGDRKSGLTGVWVGKSKICAMGIKVSQWVTMHGFALNIDLDMTPFRQDFVPCGISDKGVTSLAELGVDVNRRAVEAAYLKAFVSIFNVSEYIAGDENELVD